MFGRKAKKNNEIDGVVEQELRSNDELVEICLDYFMNEKKDFLNQLDRKYKTEKDLENELTQYLKSLKIDKKQIEHVINAFKKHLWGYSKIDELICDKDISDIKIVAYDSIRIKKLGKRYNSGIKFTNVEEYKKFVNRVAIRNKVNLSDINAIQTFTDKDSNKDFILRINISSEFVNSVPFPYLHIRKIGKKKKSVDVLIKEGLITKEQYEFLKKAVEDGRIIIFCGKGASGKTTLMNLILDIIPESKSGLVIQENEELFSQHPDMMFQRVRYAKGEGRIEYGLKELSINGLLIDLDWFVIGEIKGGEALYFLNAGYTGHACMASIHSSKSTEAIDKLIDYMKYESDYTRQDLQNMFKHLNALVVFLKDYNCKEISELVGYDQENDNLEYKTIYKNGEWNK